MAEDIKEEKPLEKRLCSEIQLFDLCDLDSCGYKHDRFCSNEALLEKFEAIREEDDRAAVVYDEHEDDEDDFDSEEDYEDSEDYEE
jgi:hypothetical protein